MAGLIGNEILYVLPVQANGQPAASTEQVTTGQIAALAQVESNITNVAITTVGNGTLTAAGLVGGQITRTGPTANYSDATDSASAIVTALGGFTSGQQFLIRIKNATAFTETITAGSGVTLPANVYIPGSSVGNYYGVVGGTSGSPTVTLTHMSTVPITNPTQALVSADDNIVSTTTLLAVGGVSVPLFAGSYSILGEFPTSSNAAGGLKLSVDTSDTLTASAVNVTTKLYTAHTIDTLNATALASGVGTTAAVILAELAGTIVVATAGTLVVKAAQNSATSATSSVLANGFLRVIRNS